MYLFVVASISVVCHSCLIVGVVGVVVAGVVIIVPSANEDQKRDSYLFYCSYILMTIRHKTLLIHTRTSAHPRTAAMDYKTCGTFVLCVFR